MLQSIDTVKNNSDFSWQHIYSIINQLTTIWIEMTILYEPKISTAGHYEPEIPTAGHYEITASHYEFKN
jgi:hypothetical protein